jgi:anionic cell wall polymer biosynthesis LytR-Cps2A-Psr (LCP) family protein
MEKRIVKSKKYFSKYRKRKIWFWLSLGSILIVGIVLYLLTIKVSTPQRLIRVGICGAVNRPAVYTMREGSDLGMLVRMGHGFTAQANIAKINLDSIVFNDSIYHIPESGNKDYSKSFSFLKKVNELINASFTDVSKEVTAQTNQKEIKQFTILYVGLPAVYVLINYYPEFHRINFVHIPHSSVFLNNEYRLIDIFFTLGTYPTMRILENRMKQKIDFYMIQDRFKFIDLIDRLGGINVNLDKPYADAYELKEGMQVIDGFHAWEYIRFLDWRNLKMNIQSNREINLIQKDNFQVDPGAWERIYETRNQRQRYVLMGMRKSFVGLEPATQLDVVNNFHNEFETDMTNAFLMQLYSDLLSTKNFAFGSFPGSYSREGNKLFFYPNIPNFDKLRKEQIRKYLETRKEMDQTVY